MVSELLFDIIDKIPKIAISNDDCVSITNFTHNLIVQHLNEFQIVISSKFEPRPLFYSEYEPLVGPRDKFSKYSMKVIKLASTIESPINNNRVRGRVGLKVAPKVSKNLNQSFIVRNVTNRSASRDQNKSLNISYIGKKRESVKIPNLTIKQPEAKMNFQIPYTKRKKAKTPEPEIKILETSLKKPVPEFNFFYHKPATKMISYNIYPKEKQEKELLTKDQGICSLEGDMLISDLAPTANLRLPTNQIGLLPPQERGTLPSKKVNPITKKPLKIDMPPLKLREHVRLNIIKVHDREKLKWLLSKNLIN